LKLKKYKCLVLDHDDTLVKSTPNIHYPSFVESMKQLRPDMDAYTLEEFMTYCFDPGFSRLCKDMLGYSDEELKVQTQVWRSHTGQVIPPIYEGFEGLIRDFKEAGGYICVVSHSEVDRIQRDYDHLLGIVPDMIFGWDQDENKRKPHPYPLEVIMTTYKLKPEDLLMVDDLKPGLDMARKVKVDFVCAGWSHFIESSKAFMREHADYYMDEVSNLYDLLLQR